MNTIKVSLISYYAACFLVGYYAPLWVTLCFIGLTIGLDWPRGKNRD